VYVLRSQRVVSGKVAPRAIWVDGERIARVADYDDTDGAEYVEDFGDAVIMAGVVDSHVHVNEPGRTTWEGFFTATRAAAAGGVTTIVDMPLNSIPATTSVRALEEKAAALEGKCAIDVGLWGGAVPGNADELGPLLRAGVLGFKCFLVDSGVPEFGWLRETDLARAMDVLASHDAPLLVHAELPGPLEAAKRTLPTDCKSYMRYVASRPPEAEIEAIALLHRECARTKARTHVVHLSASGALGIVTRAKEAKLPFTAETTPHYLRLEAELVPDGATAFKCAPPIREHQNREALWKGLREGAIDLVVTDHSPCTPELKKLDLGDFDQAWGGIASLQFGLQIVWTEAKKRGSRVEDVARWMCEAPAKLAGLSQKGRIEAGRDADFVVWHPEADFTVTNECILHRNKVTPYEGQTLSGVIEGTFLRGEKVDPKSARKHDCARGRWLKR
jgi:allantoinase